MPDLPETADVVIVGGGSAGAVLAARLSQDPARTVLLLEAGPAYAPDAFPPALLDARILDDPRHDWGYTARATDQAPNIRASRGKVLGWARGIPDDHPGKAAAAHRVVRRHRDRQRTGAGLGKVSRLTR